MAARFILTQLDPPSSSSSYSPPLNSAYDSPAPLNPLQHHSNISPASSIGSSDSYSSRSSSITSLSSTFSRASKSSSNSSFSSMSSSQEFSPSIKMDRGVAAALGYATPPLHPKLKSQPQVQPQAQTTGPTRTHSALANPIVGGAVGEEELGIRQRELRVGGDLVEVSNDGGSGSGSEGWKRTGEKEIRLPLANRLQGPAKQLFVDGLVATSVKAIESIWKPEPAPASQAQGEKVLPLNWFLKEVLRRSRTSASVLQTGLYYLHRSRRMIRERINRADEASRRIEAHLAREAEMDVDGNASGSSLLSKAELDELIAVGHDPVLCGRRMFLAALITASKFLQDRNYSNLAWSKISSLDVREININERAFLALLDYRLHIDADVFCKWSDQLMRLAHGTTIIPPPQILRRTQTHTGLESSTPSPIPTPTPTSTNAATAHIHPHAPLRKSVSSLPPQSKNGFSNISAAVRAYATPEEEESEDMDTDAEEDGADGEEDGEESEECDGRSKEATSAPLAPTGASFGADGRTAKTFRGACANLNRARAAEFEREARGFAGQLAVH